MLRNSLITKRTESRNPQQNPMPKPGDYELGSLESRAAARAMLERGSNPLFVVWRCARPSWLPPEDPLRSRIRRAGAGGVVTIFTEDLNDPDLPPNLSTLQTKSLQ